MTRPDALAPDTLAGGRSRRSVVMALGLSLVAFVILLGLGTWFAVAASSLLVQALLHQA